MPCVCQIKMENPEENKYWEAPKKENQPPSLPTTSTPPFFLEVFPPHAAQGNFPTSWMEALRVKELWEPDKGEKWELRVPEFAILRPGICCCFFTYPPTRVFFCQRLFFGGTNLWLILGWRVPTFLSPHVSKHKEKGPCWGGYFGYPIWKNLQMLQFSQLKLSLFIPWSQILIHHFPWWDFSLI